MIKSLYIKNFTIINELEIELRKGLNIITGETGSGKSVLVNAVGQLCGDRSSPDLVRQKANKAIIEARLSVKTTEELEAMLWNGDPRRAKMGPLWKALGSGGRAEKS